MLVQVCRNISAFLATGRVFRPFCQVIQANSFEVFQVLENNVALVNGYEDGLYIGPIYLLIGKEGATFYDDQIVKVPQGSVVRMNGTFKYTTNSGMDKTVPRIMIMKK